MKLKSTIFREYDIRGIADKDFDHLLAYKLGRAYITLLKKRAQPSQYNDSHKPVISVGRDCRLSGEKYSNALMAGLLSAGADIVSLGMVTTPITYFSIFDKKFDGSIMVTGSHNPPDYNGFKICLGKSTLFGGDIQELKSYIEADAVSETEVNRKIETSLGTIKSLNIIPDYSSYILNNIHIKRPLNIVVDSGNGAAGPVAPEIYRKLGCHVTELFCEPDGSFPNHEADPTVEKNLQDLIRSVKSTGADLGIAFDGDADRIGVVNEKGEILWGDELLILFAREILKQNPGATIISEVKSSNRLYNDIKKNGGNPIMWKTGHSLIKAKIKETKALLAGEMSGHMFFADRFFGFDDAIYAGARLLEIISNSNQKFSDHLADLPKTFSTPEIRVECDDIKKWQVISDLKDLLKPNHTINDIDGIRVDFGDSWALVRASNTQPVIVMRFEAQTISRLHEIRSFIEEKAKNVGLVVSAQH